MQKLSCSCKELKKPDHPYEVEICFNCSTCGSVISKKIWYHSQNWALNQLYSCDSCLEVSHKIDFFVNAMKLLSHGTHRLYLLIKNKVNQ